ncbi:MAG: hypothetical protein WCA12_05100 [Burkholderiales bacterium]
MGDANAHALLNAVLMFVFVAHVAAPTIHAGFEGQIQLEMINQGPLPIRLRTGISIEQTLGFPEAGYGGQF